MLPVSADTLGATPGGIADYGLAALRHGLSTSSEAVCCASPGNRERRRTRWLNAETLAAVDEEPDQARSDGSTEDDEIEVELASEQTEEDEDQQAPDQEEEAHQLANQYTTHAWFAAWANFG